MGDTDSTNGFDEALDQYEAGKIDRRELMKKMTAFGAAAGLFGLLSALGEKKADAANGLSNAEKEVLFSRILNHPVSVAGSQITLLPKGTNAPFASSIEHRKWLFGERHDQGGTPYYENKGLRQYSKNTLNALTDVTAKGTAGVMMSPSDTDVGYLHQAAEAADWLDIFKAGNTTVPNYNYADLYGLIRLKLDWVCTHCSSHAIVATMRFFKAAGAWPDPEDPSDSLWDDFAAGLEACEMEFDSDEWDDIKEEYASEEPGLCPAAAAVEHTDY